MVESRSIVRGSSPTPAPELQARFNSSAVTMSSWRAWPKVKGAHERTQLRGRHDPVTKHLASLAGTQRIGIVDALSSCDQRRHHGHCLVADVGASGHVTQVDAGFEQVEQPEMLGECRGQDRPCVGDRWVVIKGHRQTIEAARG